MDKEKFLSSGLIDLYVLGLASEEDAEIVNQYAEAYPDIKSMITSLNVSLEQYARANSVDPPPALREKTFNLAGIYFPPVTRQREGQKGFSLSIFTCI